jgi:thiamine phosphate synthase YjbQ (UPF0047 family)
MTFNNKCVEGQKMTIITDKFSIGTKGFTDIIDITEQVVNLTKKHNIKEANAHIYVIGSTASITTIEYEPGLLRDFPEVMEKIAPVNKEPNLARRQWLCSFEIFNNRNI